MEESVSLTALKLYFNLMEAYVYQGQSQFSTKGMMAELPLHKDTVSKIQKGILKKKETSAPTVKKISLAKKYNLK